jgi:hypothetical protein
MEVCMKKLIVAVVFAVIMAAGSPVFAQERQESEFYYVNIGVEKIYPYRNGYVVQYRRGAYMMDRVYLPMSWFTNSGSKAEIITLPPGKAWPSMTVYYKSGEFSHIRLYVHRANSHPTWGVVPQNVNIDSYFEGVEDVQIKFQ